MIDNGFIITIDHEEGISKSYWNFHCHWERKWHQKNEKEADEGHTDSMSNYVKMAENVCGIRASKEEAIQYYRMAAERIHAETINYYIMLIFIFTLIEKRKKEKKKTIELIVSNV